MTTAALGDLNVRGLRKRIGSWMLEAELAVAARERAILMGPSGSGKTSLIRLIAGLDAADEGEIRLGGVELTRLPPRQREIGYVFQEQALFPALSVVENAAFGLECRGVSRRERRARALESLARVGLADHADRPVGLLSGGERQRLALVRALVWQPRLLLLDEPFSALDRGLRARLYGELLDLHRLWPVPMLLVTHDLADAEALGTRRLELREEPGAAGGVKRRVVAI